MKIILETDIPTMQAIMKSLEYSITMQHHTTYGQRRFLWEQLKKKLDKMHVTTPAKFMDLSDHIR